MLRRRACEVDPDLVAVDRHRRLDLELARRPLEHVGCLVAPLRECAYPGADDPFGVRVQLVHRLRDVVAPAARAELRDTGAAEPLGGELRPEVAEALLRVPHARDERVECLAVEPGRRDHHALVREHTRPGRHAPGLHGADVGVVRSADGEAELGARDERDVGEMRTA